MLSSKNRLLASTALLALLTAPTVLAESDTPTGQLETFKKMQGLKPEAWDFRGITFPQNLGRLQNEDKNFFFLNVVTEEIGPFYAGVRLTVIYDIHTEKYMPVTDIIKPRWFETSKDFQKQLTQEERLAIEHRNFLLLSIGSHFDGAGNIIGMKPQTNNDSWAEPYYWQSDTHNWYPLDTGSFNEEDLYTFLSFSQDGHTIVAADQMNNEVFSWQAKDDDSHTFKINKITLPSLARIALENYTCSIVPGSTSKKQRTVLTNVICSDAPDANYAYNTVIMTWNSKTHEYDTASLPVKGTYSLQAYDDGTLLYADMINKRVMLSHIDDLHHPEDKGSLSEHNLANLLSSMHIQSVPVAAKAFQGILYEPSIYLSQQQHKSTYFTSESSQCNFNQTDPICSFLIGTNSTFIPFMSFVLNNQEVLKPITSGFSPTDILYDKNQTLRIHGDWHGQPTSITINHPRLNP